MSPPSANGITDEPDLVGVGMIVDDDFADMFGGFRLRAWMYWPQDAEKRQQYLVTSGAGILGRLQDAGLMHDAVDQLDDVILKDLPPSEIEEKRQLWEPNKDNLQAAAHWHLDRAVNSDLFVASGGHAAVAAAPGKAAIEKSIAEEGGRYGAACGEVLAYVLSLATCHPGSQPSLNRALHVFKERAKAETRTIPPRDELGTMWKKWCGIAPLWAAMSLVQTTMPKGAFLDLDDASQRLKVLGYCRFITRWALAFQAARASAPLIARSAAIVFSKAPTNTPVQVPSLSARQIAWAKAYAVRA